jgi:hypothetical protein
MRPKLRLEDAGTQAVTQIPPPGTEIKIAIDLSRTKWVYCVRWGGQEQRRLTTPAALTHLQALVAQYPGCPMHLAFEACGFGYEIAWWAQAQEIAVTVIAPSRMERAPGLQVKTDRLDAGKMVRKLEQGELKGIYVPVRDGHEKRQVARTDGQALKESTSGRSGACAACCRSTGGWGLCPQRAGRSTASGWTRKSGPRRSNCVWRPCWRCAPRPRGKPRRSRRGCCASRRAKSIARLSRPCARTPGWGRCRPSALYSSSALSIVLPPPTPSATTWG